jgi:hypothetical protein
MSNLLRLPLVGSIILFAVTSSATAGLNLIINGSFEDATTFVEQDNTGAMALLPGSTAMPGWTVTSPISWIGPNFPVAVSAQDGSYFVDHLGGGGQLRQNIVTIPGDQYQLSFYLGSSSLLNLNAAITATVEPEPVALPGQIVSQTFTSTATGTNNWELKSLDFVAFTASTLVEFTGSLATTGYIGLDNVSVVATGAASVPEPASLTLLAGGFAVLGLARLKLFCRNRPTARDWRRRGV